MIGRVIRLAAAYTPWHSNCFPQAVVARVLLALHGVPYMLCLGIKLGSTADTKIDAHAWVTAGRVSVTGGSSFGEFTVMNCFHPHRTHLIAYP